jgi:hypothetical protein
MPPASGIGGYDFCRSIEPARPFNYWPTVNADGQPVSGRVAFDRDFQLVSIRRELETHLYNIRRSQAVNRQLRGQIASLERRLTPENLAAERLEERPDLVDIIRGQRDVHREDMIYNEVQIARWTLEMEMFRALLRSDNPALSIAPRPVAGWWSRLMAWARMAA